MKIETQHSDGTIRRALLSVSDKAGIVGLAKSLEQFDVTILSTGGTAKLLQENGVTVTEVCTYTGFPEMMDGRLKTLHPKIHGGLLGRRPTDEATMVQHGIQPIDLLVVNLYPFEATVTDPECDLATAVENIDIGGPAMMRAAAKNHAAVTVVIDPADYDRILDEMRASGGAVGRPTRYALAAKAFSYTARYDGIIANYLEAFGKQERRNTFPRTLSVQWMRSQAMRYGENPHQKAAFYVDQDIPEACVASARQIQGKTLSYNNVADTDAALECVKGFGEPACVIVKHANPCGVAAAADIGVAYDNAYRTDPTSAFGGIIAFNRTLDKGTAEEILQRQFVEVIIAPSVAEDALPILNQKQNIRVLSCGEWSNSNQESLDFKRVVGGMLVQERDIGEVLEADLKVVSQRAPTNRERADLTFAWKVVKFVKSNAIVYCREGATIGIGAGQMSRVYSARIAAIKAADEGLEVKGSVMASDAFFPFRDGIDTAAEVGITAVIQPGGSMRDEEVITAADEHGIAMVFTGMRHFRH